jgi:hypothetical protein
VGPCEALPLGCGFIRPDHDQLLFAGDPALACGIFQPTGPEMTNTGPNGIHCDATTLATGAPDLNATTDCSTPANSECTTTMVPPSVSMSGAASHSGSSTRPSWPAVQDQAVQRRPEWIRRHTSAAWARRRIRYDDVVKAP